MIEQAFWLLSALVFLLFCTWQLVDLRRMTRRGREVQRAIDLLAEDVRREEVVNDAERLSKLLFDAREQMDMWGDFVRLRSGKAAKEPDRIRAEIDAYRAERGWNPHGFGGEQ